MGKIKIFIPLVVPIEHKLNLARVSSVYHLTPIDKPLKNLPTKSCSSLIMDPLIERRKSIEFNWLEVALKDLHHFHFLEKSINLL